MGAWRQGPIYEPKDSRYRPNSPGTLIFFFIGRFFGMLFRGLVNLASGVFKRLRRK